MKHPFDTLSSPYILNYSGCKMCPIITLGMFRHGQTTELFSQSLDHLISSSSTDSCSHRQSSYYFYS